MLRALLALLALSAAGEAAWADSAPAGLTCRMGATPMARVELYFGAGRDSDRAWTQFLAAVVTPRFPDGLTSFEARGQWRGPRGIAKEPAHVLVIFYRPDVTSDARIEAIRTLYKRRFRQTSVLRADTSACVSF